MKSWYKWLSIGASTLGIFACIRLVTDVPAGSKYWEHPLSFIAIEFLMTFIGVALIFLFIPYWCKLNGDGKKEKSWKSALTEWGGLFGVTLLLVHGVIFVTRVFTKSSFEINGIVIADVVVVLFAFLTYQGTRLRQWEEAYADQHLLLEKIKNDQLQTELKFLRSQYHPHFLFNALNTAYFQIDEANPLPRRTLEMLSELLRYQLYGGHQKVPIRQELAYLRTYIELQKLRMSERLQLELTVDPALEEQPVYPLLFLPLIENAFKYVGGAYRIDIRFTAGPKQIGMAVFNTLPSSADCLPSPRGIGLENLKRRLELLYPAQYSLEIADRDPETYRAELILKEEQT